MFEPESSALDISDWKISNGKREKTFLQSFEALVITPPEALSTGSGSVKDRVVLSPETTAYLSWGKSPVSLPIAEGT